MTPIVLKHTVNAYHALGSPTLSLAPVGDEDMTTLHPNVDGLRALLKATPRLIYLSLKLPEHWVEEPVTLYSYEQVFPPHQSWMALESFVFDSLSVKGKDLQFLLSTGMPRL